MAGRKLKLNKKLIKLIAETLLAHNTERTAYELAGISSGSYYNWLADGAKTSSGLKFELLEAVNAAKAASKVTLVRGIGTDPDWRAAAWLLERRHPEEFGNRGLIKQEHTGKDGTPLETGNQILKVVILGAPVEPAPEIIDETNEQEP